MGDKILREKALEAIRVMIAEEMIFEQDLLRFQVKNIDIYEPEYLRNEMEQWYIQHGIEFLLKRKFTLDMPQYNREEIKEACENGDMIICVPKGVDSSLLSRLFHMECWAAGHKFVTVKKEAEDFWFQTKVSLVPEHLDKPLIEIKKLFEKENKLGLSLERYLVFCERMRTVYGRLPDEKYKTWLLNSKYENSAFLVAGFDPDRDFSVHAWLQNFHSPMVGGRYAVIPDHI